MAERLIIVGAGQAGGWAAKTLRDQGFVGNITLIGEEPYPPYERPPLSKDVLLHVKRPESTYIWPSEMLSKLKIELRLRTRVEQINPHQKRLELLDGGSLDYDRLLLTTGSRARRLEFEGSNLPGIYYLRGIDDSLAIRPLLDPENHILIIGGGWIGLEIAAAARKKGALVTLVEAADQLCARVLPKQLGEYLLKCHQEKGVKVFLNTTVQSCTGTNKVERATLSTGEEISVSAIVIGIGVVPNIELAYAALLKTENGILVDAFGQTSDPCIFAAGDVANQPSSFLGRRVRLECWANAQNQAISVAKAMLGKSAPYDDIPWFWSDQYEIKMQLLGIPLNSDEVVTHGNFESNRFTQFFVRDGKISAAVTVNNPQGSAIIKRLMQKNKPLTREQLSNTSTLQELLKQ